MIHKWQLTLLIVLIGFSFSPAQSQTPIIEVCPENPIRQRPADFDPGGIILTSFDSAALWVYDIDRNTRYPLPETRPCTSNCHLSPDAQWMIYLDPNNFVFSKMRLNGTQRTPLVGDASEVRWWNQETLLIWRTDQSVYLRPEADATAASTPLASDSVIRVQPDGYHVLRINGANGNFQRAVVDLQDDAAAPVVISPDETYFNAASWAPDGRFLAYVGRGSVDAELGIAGAELFVLSAASNTTEQVTTLTEDYGAVRINGFAPSDLSWSPSSDYIAFWVIELTGSDPATDTTEAILHILDLTTREVRRYCGFAATEHTPETPRLIWSPDGSHVAFAGNIAGDEKGALLLALDIESGIFTELSNGMFPVYGIPQLNAWGTVP